jgi:hypothetical protein
MKKNERTHRQSINHLRVPSFARNSKNKYKPNHYDIQLKIIFCQSHFPYISRKNLKKIEHHSQARFPQSIPTLRWYSEGEQKTPQTMLAVDTSHQIMPPLLQSLLHNPQNMVKYFFRLSIR